MGLASRAVIASLVLCGCHAHVRVPLLGIGPVQIADASLFDVAMQTARATGYTPMRTDAEHGRFVVRANGDETRQTTFVVQCSRDGYVVVAPEGGEVTRTGDAFEMRSELRDEYGAFALMLERAIPEAP